MQTVKGIISDDSGEWQKQQQRLIVVELCAIAMSFIHNKMAFPCARSTSSSCTIFIFVCEVAFFFIYDRSGGHLISLK